MNKIKEFYFYYDFFKNICIMIIIDMALNTISGCARLLNTLKKRVNEKSILSSHPIPTWILKEIKKISTTNKFNSSSI